MKINRLNYEAFFLDHIEGRLSPEQEIELMEFLFLNPDLAAELTDYESVYLDKEKIIFQGKSGIKKKKGELTPVTQLIALMEGDLAPDEVAELKKKIRSDEYLRVQSELLLKTKLVPDLNIRFPNKTKLKHRAKVLYIWRYAAAAAAIVVIGLTIVLRNVPDKKQNQNIVQKSTPAVLPVTSPVNTSVKAKALADIAKPALQSVPKKSYHTEKVSEEIISAPLIAVNQISTQVKNDEVMPVLPAEMQKNLQAGFSSGNSFNILNIFDKEELKELESMRMAAESSWVQQLAKRGINRLGELTGVHVQFPDKKKQEDVFAFSIGNFEVRHVSAK